MTPVRHTVLHPARKRSAFASVLLALAGFGASLLLPAAASLATPPVVSNVRAGQRVGTNPAGPSK